MKSNFVELTDGKVICLDNITHITKFNDKCYVIYINKETVIVSNEECDFIKSCLKKIANSYQVF